MGMSSISYQLIGFLKFVQSSEPMLAHKPTQTSNNRRRCSNLLKCQRCALYICEFVPTSCG